MITLNEEDFIDQALKNVKEYVDEIIIVDGGSTDKTIAISKKHGAKVFQHKWPEHFAKQRNISLKYATKDWILIMDPDETYERILLENLQLFANNNIQADMFAFPRKNYIDGKQTDAYPDRQLRFFPNNPDIKYMRKVHERPTKYSIIVSPEKMHIVHKKTSTRQKKQNIHYKKMEDIETKSGLHQVKKSTIIRKSSQSSS